MTTYQRYLCNHTNVKHAQHHEGVTLLKLKRLAASSDLHLRVEHSIKKRHELAAHGPDAVAVSIHVRKQNLSLEPLVLGILTAAADAVRAQRREPGRHVVEGIEEKDAVAGELRGVAVLVHVGLGVFQVDDVRAQKRKREKKKKESCVSRTKRASHVSS